MKLLLEIFGKTLPITCRTASSSYISKRFSNKKEKHALWPSSLVINCFDENPSQIAAMLFSTGVIVLPTLTMHYYGEILQIYHIFALFDTPKMGNLMIHVVAPKEKFKPLKKAQRGGVRSTEPKILKFTKRKASQLPEGFFQLTCF